MKRRFLFALSVLLAGVFGQSCKQPDELYVTTGDFAGFSYYVWMNDSDHEITLSMLNPPRFKGDPETYVFNETLQPDGSFEWEERGGINYCLPPSEFMVPRTFTVTFDGQTEVAYKYEGPGVTFPMDYDPRYNLSRDDNYAYEPTDVVHCPECRGARYTYTFTNADYEAAVAYTQAQDEEE